MTDGHTVMKCYVKSVEFYKITLSTVDEMMLISKIRKSTFEIPFRKKKENFL